MCVCVCVCVYVCVPSSELMSWAFDSLLRPNGVSPVISRNAPVMIDEQTLDSQLKTQTTPYTAVHV